MIDDFEYMQPLSATFANNSGPHVPFHELAATNTGSIASAAVSASDTNLDTIVADANPIEQVADIHSMTKGGGASADLHSTGSLYTAIGQDDITDGVLGMKNGSIPVRDSGGISEALLHRVVSLEGIVGPDAHASGQSVAESAVADDGGDNASRGADEENKEDDEQQDYKPSPPPSSPDGRRKGPLQMSDLDVPAAARAQPKGPKPRQTSASRVRRSVGASRGVRASSSRASSKLRRSIAHAEDIQAGLKDSVQRKREERAKRRGRGVPAEVLQQSGKKG
jgi:hypothetical protein